MNEPRLLPDAIYTSDMAGSGQRGICIKCGKGPTKEGHDGCLGTLPGQIMNACCGHGTKSCAYIQYWDRSRISGDDAIAEQERLKIMKEEIEIRLPSPREFVGSTGNTWLDYCIVIITLLVLLICFGAEPTMKEKPLRESQNSAPHVPLITNTESYNHDD